MRVKTGLFLISGELTDRLETQPVVRKGGTFDIAAACLSTERVDFTKTRVEPPSLIVIFFFFPLTAELSVEKTRQRARLEFPR